MDYIQLREYLSNEFCVKPVYSEVAEGFGGVVSGVRSFVLEGWFVQKGAQRPILITPGMTRAEAFSLIMRDTV